MGVKTRIVKYLASLLHPQVPHSLLQTFPVSVIEGLELRCDIEKVVSGLLLDIIDKPSVWGEMTLRQEVCPTGC